MTKKWAKDIMSGTFRLFTLITILISVTACELEEDDKKNINDAFNPSENLPPADDVLDTQLCYSDTFLQPPAEISKKIDILFVVDTSGSLHAERAGIASGIDAFIGELPLDVDYNVSVMLAHGSKSSRSGKLYSYNTNPKVLKSSELTQNDLRSKLIQNMTHTSSDWHSDGGEEGLYSLTKGITTHAELNKSLGFFREDAALAVVFVADENDICSLSQYPEGVTPVYDPNLKEWPAHDLDCEGINPESVFSQLKSLKKNLPMLVSGIIYTNPDTLVTGGENEIGYGYLETIQQSNGIAIDLANGDYSLGLSEIGSLAVKKLNLITEFSLSQTDFDESTLKVLVDRQVIPFNYVSNVNEVHINVADAGLENSEVYISYCQHLEPPVQVTNVQFIETTPTTTFISWKTDVPSPSQLEYKNTITGEIFRTDIDVNFVTQHAQAIFDLTPDTLYDVRMISFNEIGEPFFSSVYKMRTLP